MERKKPMKQAQNDTNIDTGYRNSEYDSQVDDKKLHDKSNWKYDKINILILFFLYILQGIPLGLAGSIPMILQNRKISYKDQAVFSFVSWPFSVKLLWAPIVDSLYSKRIGRRKTWLIPTQYLIGVFMIILSSSVTSLLGDSDNQPNVFMLTVVFFCMNFLAATQDIAVDGWALTMLSRQNVGYASTCNSVGQTAGYFLGNVVFLALESADFCNKYLRSVPEAEGLVTLSSFLKFWGIVFFIATTLVLIFKNEKAERNPETYGIKETYTKLYSILRLRNVWLIVSFLLTCKIAFAATDSVTGLKLIEAGVKKEHIALMAIPMVPLQILLPLIISRYTHGPKPLSVFLMAYPFRLFFGIIFAVLVWWTNISREPSGFPLYYYLVLLIFYGLHQITVYSIFVSLMAFFAQISDPSIGGTYMTLLNTICNLGGNWPSTLALWFVDPLTSKVCDNVPHLSCDIKNKTSECVEAGHTCVTSIDGYYIETAICIIIGILWLRWGKSAIRRLQNLPFSAWKCPR